MRKIWVRVAKDNEYSTYSSKWHLGTIVGETALPYSDNSNLKDMLEGPKMSKRYLIQLDNGSIEEAWFWDTYEPVADEANDD